jgi:protein phosphatase
LGVAGRASIVGAAATHVGKVREHNEDAHFFDEDVGVFVVCDGMGGHAAGEVASGIAIQTIRARWSSDDVSKAIDHWLEHGTPDAKKAMLAAIRGGAHAAHNAILAEAAADENKSGMGTTLVGAMVVGNELVFAHAGDSRAYIVRDNIAMQLTEDHTLLSRLLAAGIDVDVSGEGSRFRSMLTNALGIGQECKISMFVVPLADGDRFLLASDGITEYVPEPEVGTVLTQSPSPARAAQKLIDLALERGGGDNATAVVIRVLEAGETPQPVALRRKDDEAIQSCPLWDRISPQQRLRALRIALSRDFGPNERLPAHTLGERVAWIIIEGKLEHRGKLLGPGSFIYPESLVRESQPPDRDSLATTRSDVRGLVLRADDFNELCEDDPELAELLHETLGKLVSSKRGGQITHSEVTQDLGRLPMRAETSELIEPPPPVAAPLPITLPEAKPRTPIAIPSLVGKPKEPEPPPDLLDLGSALRADLGGEHAVPQRRSGPKLEVRDPVPSVRAPTLDDEPEIEAVVEMEADAPPETAPDDDDEIEMTIEADEPEEQEPIILGASSDDDETMPERRLGPQQEEETIPERRPRTSESIVVSGTIPSRPKRLSEGWED